MRLGYVVFPGTWSDDDTRHALTRIGHPSECVWHTETDLERFDVIILPGGFSYGDYLRAGSIARFSPVMKSVRQFASKGGYVLGVCNGFQILCEAGILPGSLLRNSNLRFRCEWVHLKVENKNTPFTRGFPDDRDTIRIPISHAEGNYQADQTTIRELEEHGRVVFRYCSPEGETDQAHNPNGSANNIAGIMNSSGNVMGMMPHPERACEEMLGGTDGNLVFESIAKSIGNRREATAAAS